MKARPGALETRVLARKAELIAEIIEYKKNSSRFGAAEAIDRIKVRLADLAQIVKDGVADDWAKVDPKAKLRFDEWLAR
jgi:prephenate dehydrogenase